MTKGKEPYPGAIQNLKPTNTISKEQHIAISRKGGQSKSQRKINAVRINGLYSKKKLTEYDRKIITYIQEKDYTGLIDGLIQKLLIDYSNDPKIITDAITKLQAGLPKTNINLNIKPNNEYNDIIIEVLNSKEEWKPAIKEIKKRLGENIEKNSH
jgi:hypothetical protein